jgi:hypothetical protein
MNTTVDQQQTIYTVDAEHGRLRLVVLVVFLVAWAITFAIFSSIIQSTGLNVIALLISMGIAFALATLVERQLKQRFPSGRTVVVDSTGVKLMRNGQLEQEMPANLAVNQLFWRFIIRKRARVPKGWSMLACALTHEDKYLTVYTFMSPAHLDNYPGTQTFIELVKQQPQNRTDLRAGGEQRRLYDAESHRYNEGAEMSVDDFKRYVGQIATQFPEWMPIQ